MKQRLWLIIAIIVLVVIAAAVYFSQVSKPSNQATEAESTEAKKDIFSSIKDAMSKSLSLKCEYQDDQGKTTAYIKGSMVRATSQALDDKASTGNVILKDNKMWVWTEGEKEGILFELSDASVDNNASTASSEQESKDRVLEELEKYKNKCTSAVVSDSMFMPPSNITFQDISKLQEQMMKGINITGIPTVPTEE